MTLTSLNSNSSRARLADSPSPADSDVDEALWAAYRRYDKSAVTKQLLRRYLTAAKAVAGCSHGPTGRRLKMKNGAQANRPQAGDYNSSASNRFKR
jgi:hypothetical protein